MITTNKRTIGLCTACHERKHLAALTGTLVGLCTRCYDMAGDDNAVSDGHMTCADFKARYGEHSQYCDCKAQASDVSDESFAAFIAARLSLTDAHEALSKAGAGNTGYAFEAREAAARLRGLIKDQDEQACRVYGTPRVMDGLMAAIRAR
jgi:hypothetical protein